MDLFQFPEHSVITPYAREATEGLESYDTRELTVLDIYGRGGGVSFGTDDGSTLDRQALEDQFLVFQLSNQAEGATILESSQVEPTIEGSPEEPDVLMSLEMMSFHLGAGEPVSADTRATMRITLGKDENSRDQKFDTVFWSIAAGLQLYDQANGKPAPAKDLAGNFRKALANRPIEIPGGLGKLSFEVVKHSEPPWWRKIFRFAAGDVGKNLVSVLGFPAVTHQAIGALEELLNRLTDSQPEILYKSLPMRLALSRQARQDFSGGNPRVKIGCVNPGFCVLARGRDFEAIAGADAFYYPTYGKLVPNSVSQSNLLSGRYDDPFEKLTYAIFRVGMKKTALDPTFNFG